MTDMTAEQAMHFLTSRLQQLDFESGLIDLSGDLPRVLEPDEEAARDIILAALTAPRLPNEHGKNRYGLDMSYFRNVINRELNRPLVNHRPDELARICFRIGKAADAEVLKEKEFRLAGKAPEGCPDDIRAQGMTVAVHNDYRLNGKPHTFWLFVDESGMSYKGEGLTDADALNQVRALLTAAPAAAETKIVEYDLSPATVEGAIRQKLIELGWTPPGAPGKTARQLMKELRELAKSPADQAQDESDPMPMPLFQTIESEKLAAAEARVRELEAAAEAARGWLQAGLSAIDMGRLREGGGQ